MKKKLLLLLLAMICLVPASISASSAPPPKNVVLIDAKSGRAFVPLRILSGFKGTSVQWNAAEQKIDITKGDVQLTMFVGKKNASVNEQSRSLTDAPFTEAGVTYVPLQPVSEVLNLPMERDKNLSSLSLGQGEERLTLPLSSRGATESGGKPIASERKSFKVGGKTFSVQMVTISLMDPKVRLDVVLAGDKVGKVEDLSSIAKRHKAAVAVNGTFFDAYTSDAYKAPYGYIVSGGEIKKTASGDKRTIFTYDQNLLAQLLPGKEFSERYAEGRMEGALQAGPRLVVNGKVALDVKAEGFKDPKILTGGGARSALGLTRDHKLILLTTGGATIPQLAEIMKQAGAYQAMNLDGGASSGLYYNGKYLTTPGRKISNALIVTYQ
ncbi:phosphodiester glycosidase family protein [Paenibacillus macerans]|uniref:phosphodiester glycosidase family protein n=1 Tax=Paenibacillus macerans TaxID=44252 RepID=UPI00203C4577|nr:phosphodiester glycosidase family protein [Paenibacillus macerans]MCM3700188.1 phosphodiester glycosidase family protein [Paenibacillus macerans]